MNLQILPPHKALNKAYLKEKVNRTDIEAFKANLKTLLSKIDEKETEEHHKGPVSEFLKDTWYKELFEINTKGRTDFVIHNGKTAKDTVGVILEVKSPTNQAEMVSSAKPNKKAMHELILYYLRERIDNSQTEVKHLIITNIWEWYIFDEKWFENNIYRSRLKKEYEAYKLSGKDTKFFYDSIAKPFLDELAEDVPCTYFDFHKYEKIVTNNDKKDDNKLIALYKLLSPAHLLKQPFANDSNSLDTKFYSELLHIIGLEEVKDGSKKLIQRKEKPDAASLLECTIMKLEDKDCLRNISNPSAYGSSSKEQYYNVALELCITWINRILFIKLLEGQLVTYHKGDKDYLFLNTKTIGDFDELNDLFFQVLAERTDKRRDHLKKVFAKVPYLNSSLFDRTMLEREAIEINVLNNRMELPVMSSTVLKDDLGKKRSGKILTLQYLFDFLDAYDFSSDGGEEIQEQNKNLINASVLGLIFEKINGYKDGSFFTPGFITMYMCRETIRRAVVQKFNEAKDWQCESIEQVFDRIKPEEKKEANTIINSLKICDPAVGSGHFLVSALNEIITIKSELKILLDRQGKTLRDYLVTVENDVLVITNDDGELFEYKPRHPESQRVQEALFHEKETIIEGCLFGVDINPNSVKICRLRLWIELLKNTYYTAESSYTELETLPNIDINIKCGNSLISRFALDADLKEALKKSKWTIDSYRIAVQTYRNAESKEEKRAMEELIETIKTNFRSEIGKNDPKIKKLAKLNTEYYQKYQADKLFDAKLTTAQKKDKEKFEKEIATLDTEIKEIKSNKIYENAFEWRFEFPEVLDDEGKFIGFDVIMGNPPYGVHLSEPEKEVYLNQYFHQDYQLDTYLLFIERAFNIMKSNAEFSFIIPNTWLTNLKFKKIRKFVVNNSFIHSINHYKKAVFDEAVVDTESVFFKKSAAVNEDIEINVYDKINSIKKQFSSQAYWQVNCDNSINIFLSGSEINLKTKLEYLSTPLSHLVNLVIGVKPYQIGKGKPKQTAYEVKNRVYDSKEKLDGSYRKLLRGSDIQKYVNNWEGNRWIKFGDHLAEPRYTANFEADEKIIIRQTGDTLIATIDNEQFICMNNLHVITSINDILSLKYLLALINSKLLDYYHSLINPEKGEALAEIKKENVGKLPVIVTNSITQQSFVDLVDKILALKQANPQADTTALENEIDQLVYQLYGLTEEEIKIVEGA